MVEVQHIQARAAGGVKAPAKPRSGTRVAPIHRGLAEFLDGKPKVDAPKEARAEVKAGSVRFKQRASGSWVAKVGGRVVARGTLEECKAAVQ
jgi:hypothetical protein